MKKLILKQYAYLLLLIFVSACSSVGVTKMNHYQAKSENCELDIYSSENEVKKEYTVACLIDAQTGSSLFHDRTAAGAINEAKPKACECGADAIIVVATDREGGNYWRSTSVGKATIKAVKYKGK